MTDDWFLNLCFIVSRTIHFGACMLMVGVCAFDRMIVPPPLREGTIWKGIARKMLAIAFAAAMVSGLFWFICVAAGMSGLSLTETMHSDALGLVWNRTQFGVVWKWRLLLWIGAVGAVRPGFYSGRSIVRSPAVWLVFLLCSSMLATLPWAGHGQTGHMPAVHLPADGLHLIGAGLWPGALAPFAAVIWSLRRSNDSDALDRIADITRRFSAMSLIVVVGMATTGLVNSFSLLAQPADLFKTPYGLLLSIKVVLFVVMIWFGAINLLWHKPQLGRQGANTSTVAKLHRNVWIELLVGAIVVCVVAVLGLLPPTV